MTETDAAPGMHTSISLETGTLETRQYLYEGQHVVMSLTSNETGELVATNRVGFRATRRHLRDRNKYDCPHQGYNERARRRKQEIRLWHEARQ